MDKNEVIKKLKEKNIIYTLENSIIFIYLKEYNEENINKIKLEFSEYKKTIGFRPIERLNNEKES